MKAKLVRIGNSRGVRIPKPLIEISGLANDVEIRAKKGRIVIEPAAPRRIGETALLSERALARDWNRPTDEKAWKRLPKTKRTPKEVEAFLNKYQGILKGAWDEFGGVEKYLEGERNSWDD